jgi:3-methylfumaryl-CoA hydratase
MEALGTDGHPKLGDFLPPLELPRRMWAGGEVRFHRPIHIGETLTKTSTLSAITRKEGRTSDMVFVTVDHELASDAGILVTERQDIVYLPMPETYQPPKPVPAIAEPDVAEDVPITQTRLFRYSAVTFNAHRIHYDLPYAQGVEKLPGLVVHGPLQATFLVHLAERAQGRAPTRLKYRSIHPMFHNDDLRLLGKWETEHELKLCTAAARGGHIGMQATAYWEDTP